MTCDHVKSWSILHATELHSDEHVLGKPLPHKRNQCHWQNNCSTNVQRWPQDPYFPFSSSVLHFSEVWKCEINLLSFLISSSTLLKSVEVWNSLTKSG